MAEVVADDVHEDDADAFHSEIVPWPIESFLSLVHVPTIPSRLNHHESHPHRHHDDDYYYHRHDDQQYCHDWESPSRRWEALRSAQPTALAGMGSISYQS